MPPQKTNSFEDQKTYYLYRRRYVLEACLVEPKTIIGVRLYFKAVGFFPPSGTVQKWTNPELTNITCGYAAEGHLVRSGVAANGFRMYSTSQKGKLELVKIYQKLGIKKKVV